MAEETRNTVRHSVQQIQVQETLEIVEGAYGERSFVQSISVWSALR